ncbi:MAG: FG-GAP-like repeat-containing protein [Ignavibacteriaceae bacterium]
MQTSNSLLLCKIERKLFLPFLITFLLITNASFTTIFSQTFVEVVDPNNPVTTTATDGNYAGAAWIDIDNDSDLDLYVTKNFLFRNIGGGNFERLNDFTSISANQLGNGTSWGDYDNDGDLDAMLTNYGGAPNRFYRNDNGSYTSLSNELTLAGTYLGNSWGDFDNDGDLDVLLTNEQSVRVFMNNGDETFTQESIISGGSRSTSLGDYDNDGDLDFYSTASASSSRGLYKNETQNGNNWVLFSLAGSISNKSAIGAKVKLKAIINGNPVWQFREVSAQNNFNGHNSLRVHFGVGDATMIDSVIIEWTSGEAVVLTNVSPNDFYDVEEEIPAGYLSSNFSADVIEVEVSNAVNFTDLSISDPNQPITSWEWDFNNDGTVDATDQNPSFTYSNNGTYSVALTVSNGIDSETKIRTDYITVNSATGLDDLTGEIPTDFQLYQNYPNPFNPSTSIKFSVVSESQVVLKVYNLLGKEVATLMNEKKTPGFYELNFGGEKLPSGIYVYRLEAGSFSSLKKMILLK